MPALKGMDVSSYSFTMEVSGFDPEQDDFEDALFEAGCGDALIVVRDQKMLLDFDRAAHLTNPLIF